MLCWEARLLLRARARDSQGDAGGEACLSGEGGPGSHLSFDLWTELKKGAHGSVPHSVLDQPQPRQRHWTARKTLWRPSKRLAWPVRAPRRGTCPRMVVTEQARADGGLRCPQEALNSGRAGLSEMASPSSHEAALTGAAPRGIQLPRCANPTLSPHTSATLGTEAHPREDTSPPAGPALSPDPHQEDFSPRPALTGHQCVSP